MKSNVGSLLTFLNQSRSCISGFFFYQFILQ